MVQMNKRPPGVDKRTKLEDELTGRILDQQQEIETGKFQKTDTAFHRRTRQGNLQFGIQQGRRRRHPDRLLSQFQTIKEETQSVDSAWERALLHEQARTEIPTEYKAKESGMVANQVGVVSTALDNFKRSKGKFRRVSGVGF